MTKYNSDFAVINKKILRLDDWFHGCRYLPLLSVRKCDFKYNERRVYSYLVFRQKKSQSTTKKQITDLLSISHHTTAKIIKYLTEISLAAITPEGIIALAPNKEQMSWFVEIPSKISDARWFDRLATYREYLRCKNSPISTVENGVLFWLNSFADERGDSPRKAFQRLAGIAGNLGVSEIQTKRAVAKLCKMKLVSRYGRYEFILHRPTQEQLQWWVSKPQVKSRPQTEAKRVMFKIADGCGWATSEDLEIINPEINKFSQKMIDAGYPREKVREYWLTDFIGELEWESASKTMMYLLCFSTSFQDMFASVEAQHAKTGTSPYSLGLLRAKTAKLLAEGEKEAAFW